VARKIGDQDAQVLIGEFLRVEGHDFLVGGEAVQKHNHPHRRSGAGFINVSGHIAATRGGHYGAHLVGFPVPEVVADGAKQESGCGFKQGAAMHSGNKGAAAHWHARRESGQENGVI